MALSFRLLVSFDRLDLPLLADRWCLVDPGLCWSCLVTYGNGWLGRRSKIGIICQTKFDPGGIMDLFLDPTLKGAKTSELFEQLREAIVSGRLEAGDRLPPTREVAAQLAVSRSTVTTVYGRLSAEGYIEGSRRRRQLRQPRALICEPLAPPTSSSGTRRLGAVGRSPMGPHRVRGDHTEVRPSQRSTRPSSVSLG